ncbi:MAG: cytochrome c oxidase subunit II [Caldilinea sp.]|nr:cytochrome c oxidase subunit II [Caldilinea sp.]MDW8441937.1 cytochrome c oxidase subunit II [Caldilineaceae bacterium]
MSEHEHEIQHLAGGEPGAETHPGNGSLHVEKWEGIWIRVAVAMTAVFIAAITVAAMSFGITVPGVTARINPMTLNDPGSPFANPGVRELAPGKYEVYMVAQTWSFLPDRIEVPVGSEVTFYLTARDVIHGLKIANTNVNMMALPGQVSVLRAKFDKPGVYNYICHEYCGYFANSPIGHHTMYGQLIVTAPDNTTETAQVTQ